jgi:GT2 family glycosyltransferase
VRNGRLSAGDRTRLRERVSGFRYRPLVSLLLTVPGPEAGYLERTLDSVVDQVYPGWELRVCVGDPGAPEGELARTLSLYQNVDGRVRVEHLGRDADGTRLRDAALSSAGGEFVAFVRAGDELAPDAVFRVVEALQEHPESDLLYTDHDKIDGKGNRFEPSFKPAWSPDLLLSTDYIRHLGVYRKNLIEQIGGIRETPDGCEDYDLVLRATEKTAAVRHIPSVLYHARAEAGASDLSGDGAKALVSEALGRRGIEGTVEDGVLPGHHRVSFEISGEPKVSLVVPTRDNVSLLKNCVGSIERLTTYPNYEILIVDNESADPATLEYLASTPHRVVRFEEPFNYSRINNFAVSRAQGEFVVLLNDDTEVIDGGWLEAMLGHAQRPEVGAVGAKLLYPDGSIQHAGVLVGVGNPWGPGIAVHAHQFFADGPGYGGAVATTGNFSAVTAACMMLRKAVFEEVKGLDEENLKVAFNDVDLCLRLRERGYSVVYTPHAELYHHESVSRGYGGGDPSESVYMRERWGTTLDGDPFYNANFSRGGGDYNLRADLLRPKTLRSVGRERAELIDPFKNPLTTSPEEMQRHLEARRRAIRSSPRTTLVPASPRNPAETPRFGGVEKGKDAGSRESERATPTAPATSKGAVGSGGGGAIRAEQLVWMFGSPRTGSTWLSKMMAELDNQERWHEPYVGLLFGSFLYERLGENTKLLGSPTFILGEPHRETWLASIRNFVVEGASARYPHLRGDQYLVVKEPNGSVGAPLLLEATPESRLIFLLRDPRDVVASRLDAFREGSWSAQGRNLDDAGQLIAFTRHLAEEYFKVVSGVQRAYDAHGGPKALVRYEDLREDTMEALKGMYDALKIPVDAAQLEAAAARHGWERVAEADKGPGKFYRKAKPGSWREDLTPDQIAIVEDVTGPILSRHYRGG